MTKCRYHRILSQNWSPSWDNLLPKVHQVGCSGTRWTSQLQWVLMPSTTLLPVPCPCLTSTKCEGPRDCWEPHHHYHKLVLILRFNGNQSGVVGVLAEVVCVVPGVAGVALEEKAPHSNKSSVGPALRTGAATRRCQWGSKGRSDQQWQKTTKQNHCCPIRSRKTPPRLL